MYKAAQKLMFTIDNGEVEFHPHYVSRNKAITLNTFNAVNSFNKKLYRSIQKLNQRSQR